jgi:ATP-dependent Lhr-like helicase
LLRRWGVVFRDLLAREPGAPRWFELLQVYRRMEARGEIRGGRFISGVAGEQFALGESVGKLRQLRDAGVDAAIALNEGNGKPKADGNEAERTNLREELVVLSAADPLNLAGILTDDVRVPAISTNRIAYLNGVAVAALQTGEWKSLNPLPEHLVAMIAERFGLAGRAMPRQMPAKNETQTTQESGDDLNAPSESNRRERRSPSTIPRPIIS